MIWQMLNQTSHRKLKQSNATDTEPIAEQWKQRGFSCGVWTDPPGQVWEDYIHPTDELFMVIEGDIELEVSGHRCYPDPGEEILIPARAIHSVRNIGKTTSRWYFGYQER